ncbi:MAG: C1 family peptidase [Hyphomonadaceae bacterium]
MTGSLGAEYCPSCGRVLPDGTRYCPHCSTKGGVELDIPIGERKLQGLLFDPRPTPAPAFRAPLGALPEKVDLRQYFAKVPVEDQLRTNSCAANAIVGALEYALVRMGAKLIQLSRLFIYYNARKMADRQGEDQGITMPLAMASALGFGVCDEQIWPFSEAAVTSQPNQQAYRDAQLHEAISFARVSPGEGVRGALAAGFPVVFGTFVPDSYYQEAQRTGVMPTPDQRREQPAGGHAMLIVGYDNSDKCWIIRNSWGEKFADKGYCKIPYATLEVYSPPDCYWVIGAIEGTPGSQMLGAAPRDALRDIQASAKADMDMALDRLQTQRPDSSAPLGRQACYKCGIIYSDLDSKCDNCWGPLQPYDGASPFRTAAEAVSPVPAAARGYQGAPLPVSERRLDGCLFEQRRSNAPVLQTPMGDAPKSVDLRQYCSPVEDQGTTNSCTANATVGALEYLQRRAGGKFTDISRLFVYYNARKLADTQNQDCGSFIHHAMASVLAHGACEEKIWPFELGQILKQPPQDAYQNAMNHEAVQYARTMLGNTTLQALAMGLPVVFGAYIPSRFYDEAMRTNIMPQPAEKLDPPGGGHAMLIVGYDFPSRTWLVRNSWGERFADKGYFRIPFATLETYSVPDHYWAIGAIEATPGLSMSGPTPMAAAQETQASAAADMREALSRLRNDLRTDFQSELDKQKEDIRRRLRGSDQT